LSDEEKLVAAKALVVAAFKLCSKADSGSDCGPAALDLATFMNGCVTALMRTTAERQRSAWWDRMREQHHAIAAARFALNAFRFVEQTPISPCKKFA
jgi:hypothetical protein